MTLTFQKYLPKAQPQLSLISDLYQDSRTRTQGFEPRQLVGIYLNNQSFKESDKGQSL